MTKALYYREAGSGRPVVLLHGMLGSGRYWDEIMRLLADDYRVIAPDLLGFGHSPKPEDADYSRDTHIAWIIRTLDEMHVKDPLILVGHSMGALIALGLAVKYPERVAKLILVGMPVYRNVEEARREITRSKIVPKLMYYGPMAQKMCAAMCKWRPLARLLAPYYFRHVPKSIAQDATSHTWYSYSRSMTSIIEHQNVPADLERVSVKTILLYGTSDSITPPDNIGSLKRYGKDITIKLVNATHQLPLEAPKHVVAAIED